MKMDFYKIMGVNKSSSLDEIRNRYIKLTREYHPDRFHDIAEQQEAERKFQDITEAYNVLKNPRLRQEYDRTYGKSEHELSMEEAERLYKLALHSINNGKYHEAVQALEQALKLKDNDGRFFHKLACVQMLNPGWIRKAEQNCLKAIALEKFNYDFKLTLGKIYLKAGLKNRAVKVITEALELNEGDKEGMKLLKEAGN